MALTDHGHWVLQSTTPACEVCAGEGMVLAHPPGLLGLTVLPGPVDCPHCVGWPLDGYLPVFVAGGGR